MANIFVKLITYCRQKLINRLTFQISMLTTIRSTSIQVCRIWQPCFQIFKGHVQGGNQLKLIFNHDILAKQG